VRTAPTGVRRMTVCLADKLLFCRLSTQASALYDRYFVGALKHDASPLSDADREQLQTQLPSAQAEMHRLLKKKLV